MKSLNFNSYTANKSFFLCQTPMVKGLTALRAWFMPNMHYGEHVEKVVQDCVQSTNDVFNSQKFSYKTRKIFRFGLHCKTRR
jgi:hypothetical protein